jgi:hypothetical protein
MKLLDLAKFAAKAAGRKSATSIQDLSIEDARKSVKISDGNKVKSETEQGLKLSLGRRSVSLDAVQTGATKLVIPTADVEAVTAVLQAAIDAGDFDAAITAAQVEIGKAAVAAKAKAAEPVVSNTEVAAQVEISKAVVTMRAEPQVDGLDLSSIG